MTSLRVASLVFRGYDLLKIANINPQHEQEARLSLWKKFDPRESGGLTGVRSQSSWEIKNATISEFTTFLKIDKILTKISFTVNSFYPIYG